MNAQDIAKVIAPEFKASPYFDRAEASITGQWENIIYPLISHIIKDADVILEIACGHGRNSEMILKHSPLLQKLILTDVNQECIDFCEKRFAPTPTGGWNAEIEYIKNNGVDLQDVKSGSVTFVYSFDSMVHFHEKLMQSYVSEIARVLKPGGRAFIHHSNLAGIKDSDYDNVSNVGNSEKRAYMSACSMVNMCALSDLRIYAQKLLPWNNIYALDCISLIKK